MMWYGFGPLSRGLFWGGGWLMGLGSLLAIAAAVVLIVLLVRLLSTPAAATAGGEPVQTGTVPPAHPAVQPPPAFETPRDIVQRRYASGEIDRDEYLQKLADL